MLFFKYVIDCIVYVISWQSSCCLKILEQSASLYSITVDPYAVCNKNKYRI